MSEAEIIEPVKEVSKLRQGFFSGRAGPGRPPGSRSRMPDIFWDDIYEAWQARGKEAIDKMIDKFPGSFVQVVANMMPKQLLITHGQNINELTDDDVGAFLERLAERARSGQGAVDDRPVAQGAIQAPGKKKTGAKPK